MDAGNSFTFPFEDRQWASKLGLGAVISIIPILNFAWSGYLVGIIRNVMDHALEPLPAWDDLGKKFTEGLILFGASIVYALPLLLGFCLPLSMSAFSGLFSGNSDMQDIARTITEAGGALFYCLLCVFVLYAVVLSIVYPAILILFAREGTFASCFKLREAFDMISKNAGSFFVAWGVSMAGSLGVGLLVGLLNALVGWIPCIGWIIGLVISLGSGVYITAVYAHLFAQFGIAASGQRRLAPVT